LQGMHFGQTTRVAPVRFHNPLAAAAGIHN
jgi:hypothetical protein